MRTRPWPPCPRGGLSSQRGYRRPAASAAAGESPPRPSSSSREEEREEERERDGGASDARARCASFQPPCPGRSTNQAQRADGARGAGEMDHSDHAAVIDVYHSRL